MFSNILVVCVGNICRSPTGERLLQSLLPNKKVASAGIAVEKSHLTGKPADDMASTVALEHDISLEGHSAQQLTPELCAKYDLILVMEKGHQEALTKIAPEARGKTMLFGQWIGGKNIPDPHRQSREAFDHAYALIEEAAHAWTKKL
ncbi:MULTISPECIES: protein-tyrosine-phosphatase [Vibrio]|uniref:arsenate reductase/protein-tyrosine-phosphatase family protein n=1 Tax=Vibrio TaxID=662 RepID=UPI0001544139|nr:MULTISPECIES: protein-tyrosine-phosphatase [Vibrio]EDL69191.1 Low molecular weight protein-tyrosine-phosphatase etp [Vibrio campbellii HY01]APX08029.1 phosphotyrosine protein phosphatase [Vibrio campbellii]ARR09817.1 protein tyrosine phosphatase [Vibrio campbellii]ARR47297.1 phosphotyrosine protein phosphatase [Vibrio campbellii]AUV89164.1 phosphotyrosine protein phosphatase [Vibrio campbellii]